MEERRFDFGISRGAATTFQSRIAGMALAISASVLALACAVFIGQQWLSEQLVLDRHQMVVARLIAAEAQGLDRAHDPNWASHALDSAGALPDVRRAYIVGPDGQILKSVGQDPHQPPSKDSVTVRAPFVRAGAPAGEVVLDAKGLTLREVSQRYIAITAALFFAAIALALFMAKWQASRVTEPVRRLSDAMKTLAERKDFTQRVEPIADDELGRLTDTFNSLLLDLRMAMDELVKARDAAEAANVLKSQFLANMSHEIRTPLNGVLAMAQIMAMGELADPQRERLEVVRQSGEALLAILNDVLDLSKIEAGRMELDLSEFELGDLAWHAQAAYGEVAKRRGLDLVVEMRANPAERRTGDVGRLRQIASNLLSNALKFTERGEVRLALAIETQDGEEWLRLSVSDTGIGIPEDKQSLLFQKFTQVDNSSTRKFSGTGLGLAICRELATLMGGRITVQSAAGAGSTFTLLTPLPKTAAATARRPARNDLANAGLGVGAVKVLAAEDNPANQLVLKSVMQAFGVNLTMVADGRKAVDAWRGGDFDIILMDIQMPVMDGVEATRAIRAAELEAATAGEPLRRIPIVALSANAMAHQVKIYLEAGMDDHLAKPIELSKLQGLLRAVGEGGRGAAEAAA
jgi:signal transduction histidine kinase